jgi:hypothetical protein
MPRKNKRLALIGPSFFSYTKAIESIFINRGFFCINFDERHSNSLIVKILYRLQVHLFFIKYRDNHFKKIFDSLIANRVTDLLLINTEVITVSFIKLLKANNIKVHLYLWDSIRNKRVFLNYISHCNTISSFEPDDCKKYNLVYIPLFAEDFFKMPLDLKSSRKNNIVFNATLHSRRAKDISIIESCLLGTKFKLVKMLYYHSKLLLILKCFFKLDNIKVFNNVRFDFYPKSMIASNYFNAKFVLDIHHFGQGGLTSRTFEALRSGAYLITSNPNFLLLPRGLRSRVIYLSDYRDIKNKINSTRCVFKKLPPKLDYFLSADRFVDNLIKLIDIKNVRKPAI